MAPKIEIAQMRMGKRYRPVKTWVDTDDDGSERFHMKFGYNPNLINEIKAMEHRKWHNEEGNKHWSVKLTERNKVTLAYLMKDRENPFWLYVGEIESHEPKRDLWVWQQKMYNFIMTRRYCLLAAEMGTGKSLPLIEAMELSHAQGTPCEDIYYVSTKAGLTAMRLELKKWCAEVSPTMYTFEQLVKVVAKWPMGKKAPKVLIGDESSRLKGVTSARSMAFNDMATLVRFDHHPSESLIVLATGTPAPLSPLDWWHQCEICFPAFIKEGNTNIFERALALFPPYGAPEKGLFGGRQKRITWLNDSNKCGLCGVLKEDHEGDQENQSGDTERIIGPHGWEASVNEVSRLFNRLSPMVLVINKKDVQQHLPDKKYAKYLCEQKPPLKKLAEQSIELCDSAIQSRMILNCLSDGFQMVEKKVGMKTCPECLGTGEGYSQEDLLDEDGDEDWEDIPESFDTSTEGGVCFHCDGDKEVPKYKRSYIIVDKTKIEALKEIIEDNEDENRLIIFAAFRASIDLIKKTCIEKMWCPFVVDGRGWMAYDETGKPLNLTPEEMIEEFQSGKRENICWIGHPKSSGMSVTLTAASLIIFYSNNTSGEDRFQAEDRAHREGMDLNKGLTILDIFNLPTDFLNYLNLHEKKKNQEISKNSLTDALKDPNYLENQVEIYEKREISEISNI